MDSYVTNYRILDLAKTFFLLPIYIRQSWTPLGLYNWFQDKWFQQNCTCTGMQHRFWITFPLFYVKLNNPLRGLNISCGSGFVEFRNWNYFRDLSWKVWHFWCCGSSEEILRNPLYFTALFHDHFLMVRSWPFNLIITPSKNHFLSSLISTGQVHGSSKEHENLENYKYTSVLIALKVWFSQNVKLNPSPCHEGT